MKKILQFLIISLAPVAIVFAYSALHSWIYDYTSRYYDMLPLMATVTIGYVLIGVVLLLICKKALTEAGEARLPFEFLVGALLVIAPILCIFIPMPIFFSQVFSTGMPIIGLFLGIYISLLIILLHRRAKTLKQIKKDQNAEPML